MTVVKICGVKTLDDALMCCEAGADLIGLNFYPPSPRSLDPATARLLTDALRAECGDQCPVIVGVFVNESVDSMRDVIAIAGLDAAQLSGYETPETLAALDGRGIKTIRPKDLTEAIHQAEMFAPLAPTDERLPTLLIDAYHTTLYGGTGEEADQEIARTLQDLVPRLMLAGGLKPENVGNRVRALRPWGVDVASGVEREPGVKDPQRVQAFIAAVRPANGPSYHIDAMTPADWHQVTAIYQEGIDTRNATFENTIPTWEAWDRAHHTCCRLVARDGERVLGFAALSPVSSRHVYRGVADSMIYIVASARGKGVGKALLGALIEAAEDAGIWTLQAGIFPENEASLGLHKAFGYREVGRRERIGQMDNGDWRDVIFLERRSKKVGI